MTKNRRSKPDQYAGATVAERPVDADRLASDVVVAPTKRRGKRRYSKGLRGPQEFERHASRGVLRLARSVESGVSEWRRATDRSARRRKDGAVRDALDNFAKAVGKQLRVMSRAPEDLARAVRSLRIRKTVRYVFPLV
jgi:hypothetical protein